MPAAAGHREWQEHTHTHSHIHSHIHKGTNVNHYKYRHMSQLDVTLTPTHSHTTHSHTLTLLFLYAPGVLSLSLLSLSFSCSLSLSVVFHLLCLICCQISWKGLHIRTVCVMKPLLTRWKDLSARRPLQGACFGIDTVIRTYMVIILIPALVQMLMWISALAPTLCCCWHGFWYQF